MEKAAKILANRIAQTLQYDEERELVVAYGLTGLIQTTVTVLLVLIFGLIAGVPVEALIICFSVSILRKYSGGSHADSIHLCTAMALLYSVFDGIIDSACAFSGRRILRRSRGRGDRLYVCFYHGL